MGLFGRKPKGNLGIDFGAGGIKVLQLKALEGQGALFTYGFTERAAPEAGMEYLEDTQAAGALLKLICLKARTTVTQATAALPIPQVFSAVISLTAVPAKELAQAVRWEAKKLIPLPLEEVALDFKVLRRPAHPDRDRDQSGKEGKDAKEEKTVEVLLTAAPKGIIEKYLAIAKIAGLTLTSLETEAFALIRALLDVDPTPTVIVDIGAARSNILMVDRGIPMFTRSIEVGGKKCTEAIAASLGVDATQAEALKRDLGIKSLPGTSAGTLPEIMKDALQPLIQELRYSFNVYRTRNTLGRPPERIILTGGGSGLPGLAELCTTEFNLRTFVGNPWERVQYHPDLASTLQAFGSRFSVAIGLALRNL